MRLNSFLALLVESVEIRIFDADLNLVYKGYSEDIFDSIDDEDDVLERTVNSIHPGVVTSIYLW